MNRRLITLFSIATLILSPSLLTSCSRQEGPEVLTAEQIRALQEKEERLALEKREREREENRQRIMEELRRQDLEKEKAELAARERSTEESEEAAREAEEAAIDWDRVESKMAARLGAVGTELGTVRTRDGKVLKEVLVKSATGEGLTLYAERGVVEVAYGDLLPALQKKFLYDAEEAAEVAAGKSLPRLSPTRYRAVRDRIAAANAPVVEDSPTDPVVEEPSSEDPDWWDGTDAGGESLLAKRRRIANELNAEAHKLSKMKDAGFGAGHASVVKQRAVISKLEKALRSADAAVMEARRARVGS